MNDLTHVPELKNLPLSSNQWRLWITYHQDKANPAYNLQLTYHLPLSIDYALLKKSLSLLFERHHTMFSVFKQKDGNPYIDIVPGEVKTDLIDFSQYPAEDRRNKILDFAGADSRKPFDIENGPLYRLYLLKENEKSFYFHATVHHLVFDGWSRRLFVIELGNIYNALFSGKEYKPEPLLSYSYDFAKIESETTDLEKENEMAGFWKEYLMDCPAELRLPLDRARPAFSSGLGRRLHFELSKECFTGLKAVALKEGVSLFNVSAAVLGTLLSKYTGETEICIGVPVSTRRNYKSSENVFGLFVSTSVLRLSVDAKSTFGDFLKKSGESLRRSLANSKLPFDKIVEAAKPERRPGINPLFQVSLSYMTDMTVPMQINNIACERVTVPDGVAPFDISFYMWEENDTIKGDIEYDIDIFDPDTIDRLRESFISLAESVAGDTAKSISDLSIVSEKDKRILDGFNNTGVAITDCLIQDLFEEAVLKYADKAAVVQGNISFTYKDLDRRANKLAGYLLSLGAKSGDTIGVCLERTPDMITAVLGVLKAGCSYLPMDPLFPDDRLNYMFMDSEASILVSQSSLKEKISSFSTKSVVFVDEDAERINACSDTRPSITATPDYQAYIIYTSGSTGKPKGVPVRHKSVVNLIKSMTDKPGINSGDNLLAVVTLSFDMSVYEIFLTLSNGATLVVADSKDVIDGMAVSDLITNHNITVLQATPSFWHILLASGWKGKKDLKALCGGEALTPGLIKEMLPRVGEFWNCYGPTETTVYATCTQVTDPDAKIHIGKPINNTTAYILDNSNKVLPVGLTGELAIGGIGLARGYRNRPELTEEKFIRSETGETLYKTGDVGKFLPDGNIELFGRADNQVKLRGFRIEPGEIETLLTRLPHVKEAVVKLHHFADNDERLIAFLNAGSEFSMSRKELIATLSQDLPSYMVPFFYQVTQGFPRLPNGKINKKLLKYEAAESDADRNIDFEALSNTQKTLYSIWGTVLKTVPGSLDAGFFDIGGNSILGIRLLNSISESFGVKTDFREITEHSSFSMMSQLIDDKLGKGVEHLVLRHIEGMNNLPLTANQKRLWMISQMQPDIPSYIIRLTYRFTGSLDQDIFRRSIGKLFDRHYTLFSVIKESSGEPYFEIKIHEPGLLYEDYSALPDNEKNAKTGKILNYDSVRPFDFERGPLYRCYLFKTAEKEYLFHFTVSHIIFDGWSQGIFAHDLSEIYNSLKHNRPENLPELKFRQYDYAGAEKNKVISNESVEFWKEYLAGCSPVLNFPYDFQRSGKPSGKGSTEEIKLPEELSGKLHQLSKDKGVSLFTLLLSAFGLQLAKYSGESDLNIGLPVAHRPHSSLENVFGMFVNTVVVRLKYDENDTFSNLVSKANDSVLSSISHQDVTFDLILEKLKPERVPNANPLFQVAFAWQDNLNVPVNIEGVNTEIVRLKDRPSVFDLTLYLWDDSGVIGGEIEYNRDLLMPETVARFRDHFITLLNNISGNINISSNSVSLITDAELKMISEVNSTKKKFTDDKTIIRLFEERAEKIPGNIAIEFDGTLLTYSELNQKAEKLAATLLAHGLKRGDFAGLLLKRSPDLIVTLLALFKIGAAYVPLNLTDPEHRVFSIMETAKLKFLIVNSDNTLNVPESYCRLDLEQLLTETGNKGLSKEEITLSPADSAYIIFTSGTTGVPKGVWVNHRAAVNLIEWVNETFNVSSADKLLWATNLSFDLSVYDIFGILIAGGIIRILNDDDRLDPGRQYEIILQEGITFWDSAPQALNQVSQHFTAPGTDNYERKLRLVFLSGDWIPLSLPPAIKSAFPGVEVVGLGGATEATVWSNYFIIGDLNPSWKSIPYGKPIQNSRYYVLDEKLSHCWVLKPGDLYIGGDCLALGYYNDKTLTDKKFIPDPYNPGERLYFTGDKAQWMPDGNIEFLGREDDQLKVRGYRVELGEIKNAVLLDKRVKDAVIVPDKTDRHNIKIYLFVILQENETLETKDLRKELRGNLPEYMLPSCIHKVEKFPMTYNGKLDSKSLLSIHSKSSSEGETSADIAEKVHKIQSSLTEAERKVYQIWVDALGIEDISTDDDFFDVGGNSLLAIRLINSIRETCGVTLTFRELVSNSVLRKLAALLESKKKDSMESFDLVHLIDMKNLPLTSNQKRLWLISKLQPGLPSYIISFTYRLNGSLNREALEKSLALLLQRHHILFSVIKDKDGDPYCEIAARDINTQFLDVSGMTASEKEEKINEIFLKDQQLAFDLENGPLFRFYLIKTGEDEHYFRVSIHHIVFDGWSQGVFISDLSEIYNSTLNHKDPLLGELKFQQYDYAQFEKSIDVPKDKADSVEYWKETLKGCSPLLNFPYDFQITENQSGRAKFEGISLPGPLSEKIKLVSRDSDASLFATMLSIYGILMSRYSNDDDINIGVPVAFRPHSELENILGMFVNTVVMRLKYDKGVTFRDIIRYTSEVVMNAIAHQDIPFETVVETVNPERSYAKNPLFQASFAWQNNLAKPLGFDGVKVEKIKDKDGTAIFDIILYMWESDDHIEGEFEYSTDLLKQETIIRLKNNLIRLAENLVENPDASVETLPVISEAEKGILEEINNTQTDYPRDKSVIQLFEEQVSVTPDKMALGFRDKSFTYRELNEKANQLAGILIKAGVCANMPVGIMVDKSVEMIVGILAIMKAGGGYLPIDPDYPSQRIDLIIQDSGCKLLLTQSRYADYKLEGVTLINLDDKDSYSGQKTNPGVATAPGDMAYIMYTSGTTGTPKGSIIINQSVVRLVRNTNYLDFNPDHRILLTGAIAFDATTFEIWGALLNGGTLFVAEKETILDPAALGKALKELKITTLWLTSSLFTQLSEIRTDIFSELKYLLTGGDVISASHINRVRRNNPGLTVINGYGPTENTTFSTTYRIEKDFESNIPIGKPISNSTAYIFDSCMNLQPIGVRGELYVGGDGLSKGYLNREDLNATKFVSHPLIPGERLYRTGDFARWLDDGNIDFLGRMDNQLKIRGFRVEIEDIETALKCIDEVIEAVVKPVKIAAGDTRLAAFLNVTSSFSLDDREIIRTLKKKLPRYMVPDAFRIMHEFPITLNGKIDKNALVIDTEELISKENEEYETRVLTPTQKRMFDVWASVLKSQAFTIDDDFFDIGGNSLLAIKLINNISETCGVNLTFMDIINMPTISLLASRIDQNASEAGSAPELVHLTQRNHLPLTNNQKRLWLISMLNPELPLYNIRIPYILKGSLDPDVFKKSLDVLFNRHYIVFSRIREENLEPYCDIVPDKLNLRFLDYSGLKENVKSAEITKSLEEDSHAAYDLSNGPLYRILLIKASEAEYYFQLCIHHMIFDGWSQGVFIRDLNEIYNSLLENKEPGLEELEFQQFDYAEWEKGKDYIKEKSSSVKFWKENLEGCSPMLNFPYDFPRKEKPSGRGNGEPFVLSAGLSEKLRRLSRSENASLFTVPLSVFGIQMSKYSGEDDLNIGMPVAFRPHTRLENIFGMFVNTVVVRLMYDHDLTLRKIIGRTSEAAMNAIAHQDLPFDNVVEIVNPERSSSANPLFQVGFAWQSNLRSSFELHNVEVESVKLGERSPIFDITLYMWENGNVIEGELEYNSDLLREETVLQLKENYIHLLEKLVENPDVLLSGLSVVTQHDKERLQSFRGEERPVPDCLIQSFFESRAVKHPDKAAVVFGEKTLTYRELEEKANQTANYLISLGVKGGEVVGVCLERSEEMIVSVLGILKAGCCYLPMDPSFPDDRIQYMFEDSGAGILISQSSLKSKFHHFSNAHLVLTDTNSADISGSGITKPALKTDNSSPAYIIYTSGSTGKPKGVVVHHKAVVNLIESMSVKPGVCQDDRVLAVVTLSFDMSVYEIFVSLSNGATVVVAGSGEVTDGHQLIKTIEKHDITEIQATPSFWNILLAAGWEGKKNLKALCGGEALTYSLINQMLPRVGEFWNCYGPTETTVYSTCMQVTDADAPIIIGKPLNNTVIYIIDKYNNLLPPGVAGEVVIGGTGVTRGYLNKPELTAEKFIKFEDGSIVYKTGDQGKLLNDGSVELFGRLDNQIKLRGFRIEPGEIETRLAKLPDIKEAVVKLHHFGANDDRLVAFIEVEESYSLTREKIIGSLAENLPQYMIPSFFQTYRDFPRLPNGKINKKALSFNEEVLQAEPGAEEKRTPTEEVIYQIWKEALKTGNISVKDNFFFLGGNSLLAISVFSQIEKAFKMDLGLRVFFDKPHIKDIAEQIDVRLHLLSGGKPESKENTEGSKIISGEI